MRDIIRVQFRMLRNRLLIPLYETYKKNMEIVGSNQFIILINQITYFRNT